jgi:predicted nucleic acid-binding protein
MMSRVFFDTNVLLYQYDSQSPQKQAIAKQHVAQAWAERNGALSFQVLNEFMVNIQRKLDAQRDAAQIAQARADVLAFCAWNPVVTDRLLLENAWALQGRYGFSYWDAQVVAAALRAGAGVLMSEDMHDGLEVSAGDNRLVIANPFSQKAKPK